MTRVLLYTVGQLAALACLVWGIYLLSGLAWALTVGGALMFVFLVLNEGFAVPPAPGGE